MAIIKEVNLATGEETEREMTTEELAQREIDKITAQNQAKAKAELAAAKIALLDKLGITQEEAKLLLS